MLRRATVIVKGDNPFGWAAPIGDDEADARIQLAGMPFHFGDDPALPVPTSSLIAETGVITPHMVRWTTDGPSQQMGNAFLKNLVLRQTDRVEKTLTIEKPIDVR